MRRKHDLDVAGLLTQNERAVDVLRDYYLHLLDGKSHIAYSGYAVLKCKPRSRALKKPYRRAVLGAQEKSDERNWWKRKLAEWKRAGRLAPSGRLMMRV